MLSHIWCPAFLGGWSLIFLHHWERSPVLPGGCECHPHYQSVRHFAILVICVQAHLHKPAISDSFLPKPLAARVCQLSLLGQLLAFPTGDDSPCAWGRYNLQRLRTTWNETGESTRDLYFPTEPPRHCSLPQQKSRGKKKECLGKDLPIKKISNKKIKPLRL
jgi:hypothetical protein